MHEQTLDPALTMMGRSINHFQVKLTYSPWSGIEGKAIDHDGRTKANGRVLMEKAMGIVAHLPIHPDYRPEKAGASYRS